MIIKYTIDLTQFNNGESDIITFPTFEQCMMYGMHKLKGSFEQGRATGNSVLIGDGRDRTIVITPSIDDIASLHTLHHGRKAISIKIPVETDNKDGHTKLTF